MKTLLDVMSNNTNITFNGTQNGYDIYETAPNNFIVVCPHCGVITDDTDSECQNCLEKSLLD